MFKRPVLYKRCLGIVDTLSPTTALICVRFRRLRLAYIAMKVSIALFCDWSWYPPRDLIVMVNLGRRNRLPLPLDATANGD